MPSCRQPYGRAAATGMRVAVIGAGPAGLACAHRRAMHGHEVTLHDARPTPGGLNEYGIAAYKTVDDFAQSEIDWLMSIGGITLVAGRRLGDGLSLAALQAEFDAVFLGLGLGGVNALRAEGEDLAKDMAGVADAIDFTAALRHADGLQRGRSRPHGMDDFTLAHTVAVTDLRVVGKVRNAGQSSVSGGRKQQPRALLEKFFLRIRCSYEIIDSRVVPDHGRPCQPPVSHDQLLEDAARRIGPPGDLVFR